MDIVYVLQVVTICISTLTLIINVLVTTIVNKQKNYNEIITSSRLDFMKNNRDNAAKFAAEAKNIALNLKCRNTLSDLSSLYFPFEQIKIALKPYNHIDKQILDAAQNVLSLIEQSVIDGTLNNSLTDSIDEFVKLINIYDDADWKFIKQQFNSTNKKSEDFDKICNDILLKYTERNSF